MVWITHILRYSVKEARPVKRKFLDSLRIHVTGGSGGMGYPKYGGIGGAGGDIFVTGREGVTLKHTLQNLKSKRIRAENGGNSTKSSILGTKGEDISFEVPIGVTVFSEAGVKLGEVNRVNERVLVAKGGYGGHPDSGFSGVKGESHTVTLDLKIIADIGLVGFPNAGKSTILSIVSRAKPKIASYPFTTIEPNIGIMEYPDGRCISVADLPGLIEGAHVNIGMGHRFLKHVERTKLLLMVVDVRGFRLSYKYKARTALETIILLNKELELYREDLLHKPVVLIVNKMDSENSDKIFKDLQIALQNWEKSIQEVPEEYRPTQGLMVEKVLSMTAKDRNPDEISNLKKSLRDVLDSVYVKTSADLEKNLLESMESVRRVRGPALV